MVNLRIGCWNKGFFLRLLVFGFSLILFSSFVFAADPSDSFFSFDVLSNGNQWFVCNATGGAPLFGELSSDNYVSNFGTMTDTLLVDGKKWCPYVPEHPEKVHYARTLDDCGAESVCCVNQEYDIDGQPLYDAPDDYFEEFFQYTGDTPGSCYVCYELLGDSYQQLGSGSSSPIELGYVDSSKELFYFADSNYMGSPYSGCEEQRGVLCNDGRTCSEPFYPILSSNRSRVCCYNANEQPLESQACYDASVGSDQLTCNEQGGVLIPKPDNDNLIICNHILSSSDSANAIICCGHELTYAYDLFSDSLVERFICYQESGNSYFGECCWGDTCRNVFDSGSFEKQKLFTSGSALHTFNSFDYLNDGVVQDMIRTYNFNEFDKNPYTFIKLGRDYVSRVLDWSEFDTLNFDIGYTSSGSSFPEAIILNLSNGERCEYFFNDSFIYNFSNLGADLKVPFTPSVWHRISINYTGCVHDNNVTAISLNYSTLTSDDLLKVSLDNFFLSKSSDIGTGSGLDTYYCSALAGVWLDSLNPPCNNGDCNNLDYVDYSNPVSWVPYSYTCNDQLSFKWTGRHCCGSNTQKHNYGEYYEDYLGGCFGGFPVMDNQRVNDALRVEDDRLRSLLFSSGNFYLCPTTAAANQLFDSLNHSINGSASDIPLINNSNKVTLFETVGDWYCSPEGWDHLENASVMKIIASSFLNFSSDDFTVHCGNSSLILNTLESDLNIPDLELFSVDNACVFKNQSSILIGVAVPFSEVNDYLNNNLKLFKPLSSLSDNQQIDCTVFNHRFNSSNFYQPCDNLQSDLFKAYYNKPYGILIFGLNDAPNRNFFQSMWDFIVNFFKSFFTSSTNNSIHMTLRNIDRADFDELYVKNINGKQIYGLKEVNVISVNYTGFVNLNFLKNFSNQWFDENKGNHNYNIFLTGRVGNQVLSINTTHTDLINSFNWNYLTSNLKFE